ncbi:MAG: cyclohexadienyl dehydrogenase [Hyphococcus sp.]|nr:MAG: cyclohexadienyl dehydrogenase [Marinicaulis sp.]
MTDNNKALFPRTAIIGVGLIGSSLALALREQKLTDDIIGVDQSADVLARAKKLGVIDTAEGTLASGVKDADLIVLSTPVGAAKELCASLAEHAKDGAVIIDVGSIKGAVADAASSLPERLYFVPSHPVAGTEQSGPEAGFPSLFKDRWCILTPLERQDAPYLDAVEKVKTLWQGVGADIEVMDAAHHDLALAVTSHLPHLIAFTLVGAADDLESVTQAEIVKYSAGGFRDFTRIAASNPVMWRDVFLNNREAVIEALGRFTEELTALQRAIRWGDGEALHKAFERGRDLRKAIVDAGQETAAPNFGRDES